MEKRLSINTFNFIASIIGAILTAFGVFFIMLAPGPYYTFGLALIVTNIIGLVQTCKRKGSVRGNVLGLIASVLHMAPTMFIMLLPSMVLYILSAVFCGKDKIKL